MNSAKIFPIQWVAHPRAPIAQKLDGRLARTVSKTNLSPSRTRQIRRLVKHSKDMVLVPINPRNTHFSAISWRVHSEREGSSTSPNNTSNISPNLFFRLL